MSEFQTKLAERKAAAEAVLNRQASLVAQTVAKPQPVIRTYVFNPQSAMSTDEQMEYATVVAAELAIAHKLGDNKGALAGSGVKPGTDTRIVAAAYIGRIGKDVATLELYNTKNGTPKMVVKGFDLSDELIAEGWYCLKTAGGDATAETPAA